MYEKTRIEITMKRTAAARTADLGLIMEGCMANQFSSHGNVGSNQKD
jgi:hypothetical protein